MSNSVAEVAGTQLAAVFPLGVGAFSAEPLYLAAKLALEHTRTKVDKIATARKVLILNE